MTYTDAQDDAAREQEIWIGFLHDGRKHEILVNLGMLEEVEMIEPTLFTTKVSPCGKEWGRDVAVQSRFTGVDLVYRLIRQSRRVLDGRVKVIREVS